MVTTSFRRGITTLAPFQNSSSVGCTSGSASIPFRISASLMRRSLSQSVLLVFEALPEVASFLRRGSPRGDDAPRVIVFIRVDHCDFYAVHKTDRVNSDFAIIETVVNLFDGRTIENSLGVVESNSVSRNVAAVLPLIPNVVHRVYLHNVNMRHPAT